MMTMKSRKHRPDHLVIHAEVCELDDGLSFLDVLAQACARGGRHTLTVKSADTSYTVLVDREGPFNATGGGSTGSPALVRAAQLRRGQCALTPGWPVEQPMYQPGLDRTLRALLEGVVEPPALPRHRGVDSLRNAEFRSTQVEPGAAADTYVRPPQDPSEGERLIAALPAHDASRRAIETPRPVPWRAAATPPTGAAPGLGERMPANGPGETAARLATRALLWVVDADAPAVDYTLSEAASLAGRGLVDGIADLVEPIQRDLGGRIDKVRKEWERSGEVAARNTEKRMTRLGKVNPDREFRLR